MASDVDRVTITCTRGEHVSTCQVELPQKTVIRWRILSEKLVRETSTATQYDRLTHGWMNWSSTTDTLARDDGKLIGRYGEGREVEGEQVLYYPPRGSEIRFHGNRLRISAGENANRTYSTVVEKVVTTFEVTARDHTWNLRRDEPVQREVTITLTPVDRLQTKVEATGIEAALAAPGLKGLCPEGEGCTAGYTMEDESTLAVYDEPKAWTGLYITEPGRYPPTSSTAIYNGQPAVVHASGADWDRLHGTCGGEAQEQCQLVVNDPAQVTWSGEGQFPCSNVAEQAVWVAPSRPKEYTLRASMEDTPLYDDKPTKAEKALRVRACRLIIYGHTKGTGHVAIGIKHWGDELIYGLYPKAVGDTAGLFGESGRVSLEEPRMWQKEKGSLWRKEYRVNEDCCKGARAKVVELVAKPPDWYLLGYNCVDFVRDVAAAGCVTVPSADVFGSPSELWRVYRRSPSLRSGFREYSGDSWEDEAFPDGDWQELP